MTREVILELIAAKKLPAKAGLQALRMLERVNKARVELNKERRLAKQTA